MMRKLMTLVLAIALIASLALTSFAAWHPSIDSTCNHDLVEIKINDVTLDAKDLPEGAIRIVDARAAKEENDALPKTTDPDTMTKTGLTYGQNAALVKQFRKTIILSPVSYYIESHKINKDWGTEEPMKPIDILRKDLKMDRPMVNKYDFVHVYDVAGNVELLRKAAGLKDDEPIEAIDLTISCAHFLDDTVAIVEADLFKDGSYIEFVPGSGRELMSVEDLRFVEADTAKKGFYTLHVDMKDVDIDALNPHVVCTMAAKQAPAEHIPTPAN